MGKYIDAEETKKTFCAECNHTLKCEDCDIDFHFRYAPAADVVEVRHGRWVEFSPLRNMFSCSLCGQWGERLWNYCPNCGAKMVNKDE